MPIRFNTLRFTRASTYREQNVIGGEAPVAMHSVDSYRMRLHKGGETMDQFNVITSESVADDMHFTLYDASDVADKL